MAKLLSVSIASVMALTLMAHVYSADEVLQDEARNFGGKKVVNITEEFDRADIPEVTGGGRNVDGGVQVVNAAKTYIPEDKSCDRRVFELEILKSNNVFSHNNKEHEVQSSPEICANLKEHEHESKRPKVEACGTYDMAIGISALILGVYQLMLAVLFCGVGRSSNRCLHWMRAVGNVISLVSVIILVIVSWNSIKCSTDYEYWFAFKIILAAEVAIVIIFCITYVLICPPERWAGG